MNKGLGSLERLGHSKALQGKALLFESNWSGLEMSTTFNARERCLVQHNLPFYPIK